MIANMQLIAVVVDYIYIFTVQIKHLVQKRKTKNTSTACKQVTVLNTSDVFVFVANLHHPYQSFIFHVVSFSTASDISAPTVKAFLK